MVGGKRIVRDQRWQSWQRSDDLAQDQHGLIDRGSAEKDPAQQDQVKGKEDAEGDRPSASGSIGSRPGPLPKLAAGDAAPLIEAIEHAPGQKRPADAIAEPGVPEPADHEDDHDIGILPQGPGPAAPEGKVDIVPEPAPQRYMPALRPELGHACRQVGPPEILAQIDAEQARNADSHVGIAGKVAIDLEGKEVDCNQQFERRGIGRYAKGIVDHRRQVVGNNHLLEQPPEKELQGPDHARAVPCQPGPRLRQERAGALDGPGENLREPGQIQGQPAGMPFRFDRAAPCIDQIGGSHEGIEGIPGRCGHSQRRQFRAARFAKIGSRKVIEFESGKRTQYCHKPGGEPRQPHSAPGRCQHHPAEIGNGRYRTEKDKVGRVVPPVENQAGAQQEYPSPPGRESDENCKNGGQEQCEGKRVEEHCSAPGPASKRRLRRAARGERLLSGCRH